MENKEDLQKELLELLEKQQQLRRYNKIDSVFPETGAYCRAKYPKHIEFMAAGAKYRQRAFIAGNRTGKTFTAATEMVYHLTGVYPAWWKGRVFTQPISAWAASISNATTKEILQKELLGEPFDFGSGLIPRELIHDKPIKKPGVAEAVETVYVKHVRGVSTLTFKSYEQGAETFQGTKKQLIWLDEEPSDTKIYTECLTRTMGTGDDPGIILCTFTPLNGLSEVVLDFLDQGRFPENHVSEAKPNKYVMNITWDDAPHLSEEEKAELLSEFPLHERDARTKGIPALGSGAIFPYSEHQYVVEPFEIPCYWPKCYGLDLGWNHKTAAVWFTIDPNSKLIYAFDEYGGSQNIPAVHASAIKHRGKWIPGVIDPKTSSESGKADGMTLLQLYADEELDLDLANNAVEASLHRINQLLASGTLKVFSSCRQLLSELRIYRRDEHGKVIKKFDDFIDAFRYGIMSGLDRAIAMPDPDLHERYGDSQQNPYGWN